MRKLHLKSSFAGDSRLSTHPQLRADPAAGQQPPNAADWRQPQASKAAAEALLRQQFHRTRGGDVFRGRTCSPSPYIYIVPRLSSTVSYFTYFFLCINFTNRS
ncbi:hypothetical protein CDAR_94161 [Caerostris darwini]|uniref:Uncharacterized protein n=1 Tax=Caerostris darwini TaxID=1538125 RepID=A0AAV4NK18_9ARAC|nr:hypothetical protein CDAR_94161 [Caerostris darwini]